MQKKSSDRDDLQKKFAALQTKSKFKSAGKGSATKDSDSSEIEDIKDVASASGGFDESDDDYTLSASMPKASAKPISKPQVAAKYDASKEKAAREKLEKIEREEQEEEAERIANQRLKEQYSSSSSESAKPIVKKPASSAKKTGFVSKTSASKEAKKAFAKKIGKDYQSSDNEEISDFSDISQSADKVTPSVNFTQTNKVQVAKTEIQKSNSLVGVMSKPSTANIQRNPPTKQSTNQFVDDDSDKEDKTFSMKTGVLKQPIQKAVSQQAPLKVNQVSKKEPVVDDVIEDEVFSVHEEVSSGPTSPAKPSIKQTKSPGFLNNKQSVTSAVEKNVRPTSVGSNDFSVHLAKADQSAAQTAPKTVSFQQNTKANRDIAHTNVNNNMSLKSGAGENSLVNMGSVQPRKPMTQVKSRLEQSPEAKKDKEKQTKVNQAEAEAKAKQQKRDKILNEEKRKREEKFLEQEKKAQKALEKVQKKNSGKRPQETKARQPVDRVFSSKDRSQKSSSGSVERPKTTQGVFKVPETTMPVIEEVKPSQPVARTSKHSYPIIRDKTPPRQLGTLQPTVARKASTSIDKKQSLGVFQVPDKKKIVAPVEQKPKEVSKARPQSAPKKSIQQIQAEKLAQKLSDLPKFEKVPPKARVQVAPQPKAQPKKDGEKSKERSPVNTNFKMPGSGSRFMAKGSMPSLKGDGFSIGSTFKVHHVENENDDDQELAENLDKLPKRKFSPKADTKKQLILNPLEVERQKALEIKKRKEEYEKKRQEELKKSRPKTATSKPKTTTKTDKQEDLFSDFNADQIEGGDQSAPPMDLAPVVTKKARPQSGLPPMKKKPMIGESSFNKDVKEKKITVPVPSAKVGQKVDNAVLKESVGIRKRSRDPLQEALSKDKRFQELKKIKGQKVSGVVVKKQKKPTVPKPKKSEPNADLDFGDESIIEGDQGAPPDDDYDNEDSLVPMSDDYEDEDVRGDVPLPKPAAKKSTVAKDGDDFLNEGVKAQKQSIKQLAENKKATQQFKSGENKKDGFVGNGLGSGGYQKVQKDQNKDLSRPSANIALEKSKPVKEVKQVNDHPWGYNPGAHPPKKELDTSFMKQKQLEAQEKFKELQHEKKMKQAAGDPQLNAFLAKQEEQKKKASQDSKAGAINKQAQNFEIKAPAQYDPKAISSDKVIQAAADINDPLANSKNAKDLMANLKQLFFENKAIQKNVNDAERQRMKQNTTLDGILKDKNLVRVNGAFEVAREPQTKLQRILGSKDIPDYDKIVGRENPLDVVVRKFEAKGYSVENAFLLFDDNCDELLTKEEIKIGVSDQKIDLTDDEFTLLMNAIDSNADGVISMDEWEQTLQPKLDVQKQYIQIMKGFDIKDPIILEEEILDFTFKIREKKKQILMLKRTQGHKRTFKAAEVVQQQKIQAEKIQDLEREVKVNRQKKEEERVSFTEMMKQGAQNKDDLKAEYDQLKVVATEVDIEYNERRDKNKKDLYTYDQRWNQITAYQEDAKYDHEYKKHQLKFMLKRLEKCKEMEAQLDIEIEQKLGYAVGMNELWALYETDMKLLNQIRASMNNKINSFAQLAAAFKVQRRWRGFVARKKLLKARAKMKPQTNVDTDELKKYRAVIYIQRMFRNYRARKGELMRLKEREGARRAPYDDSQDNFSMNELMERQWAAKLILKRFRKFMELKRQGLLQELNEDQLNPFTRSLQQRKMSYKAEIVDSMSFKQLEEEKKCSIYPDKLATRICHGCGDQYYSEEAFIEMHDRGHRKRHQYTFIEYGQTNENQSSMQDSLKMISRGLNETSRSPSPAKDKLNYTRSASFKSNSGKGKNGGLLATQNILDSLEERNDTFGSVGNASIKLDSTSILKESSFQNQAKSNKQVTFTESPQK